MLWSGEISSYEGVYFDLDHARLYDIPGQPIPIVLGVSGEHSVALAAAKADGVMATEPKAELTDSYRRQADQPGPCYAEVALAWAPTEQAGRAIAHERFRFGAFGWSVMSELPTVESFQAAAKFVRPEDLVDSIPAGPDVERHVAAVQKYIDAGFDRISLVGIGPDQEGFINFFKTELAPRLTALG
jgi:G6PDH family F420-dependent oxidoreductase